MSKSHPNRHARKVAGRRVAKLGTLHYAGSSKEGFHLFKQLGDVIVKIDYGRTFDKLSDAKAHGEEYYDAEPIKVATAKPKRKKAGEPAELVA